MLERLVRKLGTKQYKVYYIYTKEEADARGFKYKPWYKAEVGEMALSDDGFVGECLFAKWYPIKRYGRIIPGKMDRYVRTTFGRAYYHKARKNNRFTVKDRESFDNLSGKRRMDNLYKRGRRKFIDKYIETGDLNESMKELVKINPELNAKNWKRFSKHKEFSRMLKEEFSKKLEENGIGLDDTLTLITEAIATAKEKNDTKSMISLIKILADMQGIRYKQKRKVTDRVDMSRIDKYSDEAKEEIARSNFREIRIVAEKTVEGEDEHE